MMQGDNTYQLHLPYIQSFWTYKPLCHILNPLGCNNAMRTKGFWNYLGASYELKYSAFLQGNDACFKTFTEYKYYWSLIYPGMIQEF